jgi:deazaflavin-dependent oxidoreductase (nitroreductase family)
MSTRRRLARFNRVFANRLIGRTVSTMPGFGAVLHQGRRSGDPYRTPVMVFRGGGGYVLALPYGVDSDWVRNVLAAGGCDLLTGGRAVRLVEPRVSADGSDVPAPVRIVLKRLGATEFMTLRPVETGVGAIAAEGESPVTGSAPTSDLTGWQSTSFTGAGLTHDVYEKGSGPGVVLVPEIPGISPEVLGLAEHLVEQGYTVAIPSLFGTPGRAMSGGYAAGVLARLCVSAEFRAFAANARRPVADYLRALARDLAARTPGPGVGVIGMCFTGGFALAAAVDEVVLAPVLSQPSVPFPLSGGRRRDPGVSEEEMTSVVDRTTGSNLCVLGLRFSQDRACPPDRFATLRDRLGEAFEIIELDSSPGNAGGFGKAAHSVLTGEVREEPGHPALAARDRVVDFLRERLAPAS